MSVRILLFQIFWVTRYEGMSDVWNLKHELQQDNRCKARVKGMSWIWCSRNAHRYVCKVSPQGQNVMTWSPQEQQWRAVNHLFFCNPIFNLPYPSNRILRWCRWFVVSTNACLLIVLTNLYALRSSVHLWAVLWHFINAFRPQRTQSPSAPAGWISPYFSAYSHAVIVISFRHSSQFIIQKSRIKGFNNSSDRLAHIITRKDSAHDGGCHISSFRRLGSPALICLGRLAVSLSSRSFSF